MASSHDDPDARCVLVTGSTRGLGLATARAFRDAGWRVVTNGRARRSAPDDIVDALIEADAATEVGVAQLIDGALERHGRLDLVIANAAVADPSGDFSDASSPDLAAVLATNLLGPMLIARALLARGLGSRLIVVSSHAARVPERGSVAYAASKAGVEGMIRALATDTEPARLSVCGLRPPAMQTAMTRSRVDGTRFETLAEPAPTASVLLRLAALPRDAVHGRVFDADRLRGAPFAELVAADARATWPTITPAVEVSPCYPDPDPLTAALALYYAREVDDVVLGAGATELLFRVLDTVTRAGECVVVCEPSWRPFTERCRMRGRRVVPVPLTLGPAAARHDVDAIAEAARGARLVYLDSPNHPSGAALDDSALRRLLASVPSHVPIVVDQVYIDFASAESSRAATVRDERLIVVQSFSKAHGLAALRVGHALAEPRMASLLRRAGSPHAVSEPAIAAALRALADEAQLAHTVEGYRVARHRLVEQLESDGARTLRSEAPFVLVEEASERDAPRYFDGRFVCVPVELD